MKIHNRKMQVSVLALAIEGALLAMCALPLLAQAADATEADVADMRRPSNYAEVGAGYVSEDSAKFGEYNGLNDSGPYLIGNFSVRGGDSYEGGDGTLRWGITGTDLGTTSRSLDASMSNQGRWNLNIGYDELRHNISDTYQTPQQGSMGGNTFTYPANFGWIVGNASPSARDLDATQLAAFHTKDVYTDRKNTSFGAGYTFSQRLSLQFDYNHLDQDGAKLIGSGAQGGGGTSWRGEANNILMNPTNYQTDTFNLALNWVGDKGHLTGGYFGSIFRDGYNSLSWENAMTGGNTCASGGTCVYGQNTMSTAPDNSFHQLNLTGGYAFSPTTKLAGGLSYGRNKQNDSYASAVMQPFGLPQTSLDGKVITTHADLKLTHQATKDLGLSAGFKYNERDNQTKSNAYLYLNLGNDDYTGVNTPYSNKKTQFELAADYRLSKDQKLRLAYERENIKRWCNDVVGGAQCVASPSSGEDKLGVTYRLKAREDVAFNAGVSYAKRNADFDHDFAANTGSYPVVNADDRLGYVAYPYASRKQALVKAGVNWQATEKLDISLDGRYAHDDYDATLGVQDGHTVGINLDATYSYNENSSVSAYVSWQDRERDLRSGYNGDATTAPTSIWTNQLKEEGNAIGLNTKHRLMGDKLEIVGDLSYSLDKSQYSTQVPYNGSCGSASVLTCGSTPDIKSELITFKLSGTYQVDKSAKVALGYIYQKLNSNDYYYNAYQYGYTPNRVMPTNEQAPSYEVHVVAVSYIYKFQ